MASSPSSRDRAGPLAGLRIIEIAGLGPAPFCAMMLADHGAEVIRIDRLQPDENLLGDPRRDIVNRSRINLNVDLKHPDAREMLVRLCRSADGLIEGFRPGVMERLGLGPDLLLQENPRLVYGRMTGWGQTGPNAAAAGHDINYIALSGALHAVGARDGKPVPPLNLVGDLGGGAMMLAFGMLAAILNARDSGRGQVIDAAITDGSALLMAAIYSLRSIGRWTDRRGANIIDSGAPHYDSYQTADGDYVSIGSLEPRFHRLLLDRLGLADDPDFARQNDPLLWPAQRETLTRLFKTRTRAEWCDLLEGSDACFAPILSLAEAPSHPHNVFRESFVEVDGVTQPAPAPRYSATPTARPTAMDAGADRIGSLLAELGYPAGHHDRLRAAGAML